jgi:hypothetical protein
MPSLCKQGVMTIFRGPPSRQLSLSASLSFSLIRGRSSGFTIGCDACNGRPAVWSEHRRTAEGRLGKRVGFTPSRVRIPHPPRLVSTRKHRQGLRYPGGGFADVVSVLVSVGLGWRPEEPADSARDLMPDGIGYVLVARGHRRRRPAHHAHDCAFRHLQGQEHGCSCVPGVVKACFSHARPLQ